jgi:retinol dehydrogenase 12
VWLSARSENKANDAIIDLERETGRRAQFLHLDLGDLNQVKKSAEEFISSVHSLTTLGTKQMSDMITYIGNKHVWTS